MDFKSALNCRMVSRQWKRVNDEGGMVPLEAGMQGEELFKGEFFVFSGTLYTCIHAYALNCEGKEQRTHG